MKQLLENNIDRVWAITLAFLVLGLPHHAVKWSAAALLIIYIGWGAYDLIRFLVTPIEFPKYWEN